MNGQSFLHSEVIADIPVAVGIPAKVAAAMKIEFGFRVTGYLVCAVREGLGMIGVVYGDEKGRFANGHSIRTSAVLDAEVIQGYVVVQTLNSLYVICDWATAQSGPRFTGVHH